MPSGALGILTLLSRDSMTPGPDVVRVCPHCGSRVRERTLASGNTFGGTLWSDGRAEYPMLPDRAVVAACPACGRPFWVDDADVAGGGSRGSGGTAGTGLPYVDASPGPGVFERALEDGLGTTDGRELALRVGWWHASNDPFRGGEAPPAPSAALAASLRRLVVVSADPVVRVSALLAVGDVDDALFGLFDVAGQDERDGGLSYAAFTRLSAVVSVGDRRVVAIDGEGA